jgi:hypothetical protein
VEQFQSDTSSAMPSEAAAAAVAAALAPCLVMQQGMSAVAGVVTIIHVLQLSWHAEIASQLLHMQRLPCR